MPRGIRIAGLVLGAVALAACAPARGPHADVAQFGIHVRFALANLCAGGMSPPIALEEVPQGTSEFLVQVTNVTVLLARPQEWRILVGPDPTRIPFGALQDYAGPCPGELQRFNYRVEVLSLGRDGRRTGYGMRVVSVEPVSRQAQQVWGRGSAPDPLEPPPSEQELDDLLFRRGYSVVQPSDRDAGVFSDTRRPDLLESQPRPVQR